MRKPTVMILCFVSQTRCKRVVRNGRSPRRAAQCGQELGEDQCHCNGQKSAQVWSGRHCCRAHSARKSIRSSGPRQPSKQQQRQQQAGNGKCKAQKEKQGFAKLVVNRAVNMAAAAKVARRVPLIKFPNRKGGDTQGAVAVNRASGGGGGQSQPMPSLPSGTASSQPPRTKLTEAEIDAILLGGAAPS